MESNDIIAWSVALAAVAFVVLCGFLIALLRAAQRSLGAAQATLGEVKETIGDLQIEVKKLSSTVQDVAADVRGKLQSVDPLFDAVEDVGMLLSDVTGSARKASKQLSASISRQAGAIERKVERGDLTPSWLQWAALGSRVILGMREGWKGRSEESGRGMNG